MSDTSIKLAYRGYIDIQIKYRNKILNFTQHNEGTQYLKQVFANALTGNHNKITDTPQLLDLEYKSSSSDWQSYILSKIDLTAKKPVYSDGIWKASFTATLMSSNLSDYIKEGSGLEYRFALTTNSLKEFNNSSKVFAYAYVSDELLSKIVPGSQAIITWNMQLINESEILEGNS